MQKDFKNHIENRLSFLKGAKLLIAISGGLDSVVLVHLCHQLQLNIALAHCNFNLRAEESKADENFVLELAEELNVELFIQNFDTEAYAKLHKLSIQMAARELRYNWFQELAKQLHFDFILTAHHADDNLETFLINFTRGTGLNGLTGIPEVNDTIVRPLLQFSRVDIEAYAIGQQIAWREDSSNSSRKYLRNKLRHELVPILKEINPELLKSFQSTLEHLNDTADIVEERCNAVAKRAIVNIDEHAITYKVSEFTRVNNPKAYLFEMFKIYGFTEWNDVVGLLHAETGKYVQSNTHRLTKHREVLILTDIVENKSEKIIISKAEFDTGTLETPIGTFTFHNVDDMADNSENTIYIDTDKLGFPLELRIWATGDVFYPLGMKGKKKLSKYLKDQKLTPIQKQNTLVLTSDNKVIWVVGNRADERFKVTDQTNKIVKIALNK